MNFKMKRVAFLEMIGMILLWKMILPIWLLTISASLSGMTQQMQMFHYFEALNAVLNLSFDALLEK